MTFNDDKLLSAAMAKLHTGAGASLTADEQGVLQLFGSDKDHALLKKQLDAPPDPAPPVPARAPATPVVTRKQFDALIDALKIVLQKRDERSASVHAELTTKLQTLEARVLELEAQAAAQEVIHD